MESQIYQNLLRRAAMNICSPFIQEIPECKLIMRRLRKKISKYTSTHKEAKKPRDQSGDILNILKNRNLPAFVLETIKKRRTFDLMCLKSVVMNGESSLEEMINLAGSQEKQIQGLFLEHKQRMRKSQPRAYPKLQRRSTNCSSTEQQESEQNSFEMKSFEYSNSLETSKKSEKIPSSYQIYEQNHFEEDVPEFHGKDFLMFQGDIYSQEQWMKF